jgi:hypothetical protein
MKRFLKNGIALLIILGVGFLALNFYESKETAIEGGTISERLESIRQIVDKRAYVSVTDARREEIAGVIVARYSFNFNAPMKLFRESQTQTSLGRASGAELEKAISSYRAAIDALVRLTIRYVVPLDPLMRAIIIDIRLPDGSLTEAIGFVEELQAVPDSAPIEVRWEKLRFIDLQVVPKQNNTSGQ